MIERLVVASKNRDKIAEMEAVLVAAGAVGEIVRGLDWPDVDETGDTLEENAILKALAVCDATGYPSIADDTGLEVAALGGLPGVNTARYAGPDASYADNVDKLLREMSGVEERSATFRTVIALAWPSRGRLQLAEGVLDGRIAQSRRGEGGFGYDPVFEVDDRTLAEIGIAEKNRISHRAKAIQALLDSLTA